MRAAKNPPSFILVDKTTGEVVYTKRATGVGAEAIRKCAERGQALANKTGRIYFIYLDIMGARVGMKISVAMAYVMGITEEIYPRGSARSNPRGTVRRNIYTFNNPPSGPANADAARELELYIENDADLHRQQYVPIVKNLMLKRRKGVYDREKAVKLFMYLMESGAKKYIREFVQSSERGSLPPKIDTIFNKATREMAARTFRDSFEGEAELGNWDHLLVRPTSRGMSSTVARKGASSEFEMDMGMFEKGYRYKLIPKSRSFEPLYAKSVYDVPKVMREYPHETFTTVDLSPPRSAHENPGRVRKNIYTFNNPKRQLNAMERAASLFNLSVATWAPGDGVTRYRFFKASGHGPYADYHQGNAVYTANGRGEAMKFLKAYGIGRSRMNPLNRGEVAKAARVARRYQDISRRVKPFNREAAAEAAGVSVGMGSAVALFGEQPYKRVGHKIIHRTAEMELGLRKNPCSNPVCRNPKHGHVLPNPLLQTIGLMANPPVSVQWDRMSGQKRLWLLGFVGYPEATAAQYARFPWVTLADSAKRALERQWLDTDAGRRGGTTTRRRRLGVPVGANPLNRKESGRILKSARAATSFGRTFVPGPTRASMAGKAMGKAEVVRMYGPRAAYKASMKVSAEASRALQNPGTLRLPTPGTKMTVAQAMELARRIGDRDLIKQCQQAARLQKASDRGTRCVVWKHLPLGSPNKVDAVVAMTHYGDSPEDMYRPPKGSKKGPHMYRHKWKKSVPVLASPSGKAIIKVMGPGQKVGDWMRG
jgi:hypothetical protein